MTFDLVFQYFDIKPGWWQRCGRTIKLISPWTKWPPFWQTTLANVFLWMKMIALRFEFHWNVKCVPRSPIDNKPALVRVTAWRRRGDKPLPEPMLTQFTDAYMRNLIQLSSVVKRSNITHYYITISESRCKAVQHNTILPIVWDAFTSRYLMAVTIHVLHNNRLAWWSQMSSTIVLC